MERKNFRWGFKRKLNMENPNPILRGSTVSSKSTTLIQHPRTRWDTTSSPFWYHFSSRSLKLLILSDYVTKMEMPTTVLFNYRTLRNVKSICWTTPAHLPSLFMKNWVLRLNLMRMRKTISSCEIYPHP